MGDDYDYGDDDDDDNDNARVSWVIQKAILHFTTLDLKPNISSENLRNVTLYEVTTSIYGVLYPGFPATNIFTSRLSLDITEPVRL
jgi:hypothetical protein